MQLQIETFVDLYPTMQSAAHYWLNGRPDGCTLVPGRFVCELYTDRGDNADLEFEANNWVSPSLACRQHQDES